MQDKNRIVDVDLDNVLYFEAERNKTNVYFERGINKQLDISIHDVELKLNGLNFIRVHSKYLVNASKVDEVIHRSESYLILASRVVPISRHWFDEIKEDLEKKH